MTIVNNLYDARQAIRVGEYDRVLCDWDLGMFDRHNGGEIVTTLREEFPGPRYAIWSGLDRKVPEGVLFFSKDDIGELLPWLLA